MKIYGLKFGGKPSGAFDFRPNRTVDSNPTLSNMKGDYKDAEKHARIAVEIRGTYEQAYEYLEYPQKPFVNLCLYIYLE